MSVKSLYKRLAEIRKPLVGVVECRDRQARAPHALLPCPSISILSQSALSSTTDLIKTEGLWKVNMPNPLLYHGETVFTLTSVTNIEYGKDDVPRHLAMEAHSITVTISSLIIGSTAFYYEYTYSWRPKLAQRNNLVKSTTCASGLPDPKRYGYAGDPFLPMP